LLSLVAVVADMLAVVVLVVFAPLQVWRLPLLVRLQLRSAAAAWGLSMASVPPPMALILFSEPLHQLVVGKAGMLVMLLPLAVQAAARQEPIMGVGR